MSFVDGRVIRQRMAKKDARMAKIAAKRRAKSAKIVGAAECSSTQTAPDRNGQTLVEGAHRVTAIPHSTPTRRMPFSRQTLANTCVDLADSIRAIKRPDYEYDAAELFDTSDARKLSTIAVILQQTCEWKADDDGNWHTTCDEIYIILEGTPRENNMRFCCYCGAKLARVGS